MDYYSVLLLVIVGLTPKGTFACTEYTAAELELKMAKKCLTCGDNLDVKCSIDIISAWNSITVGPTIPHDTLVLIVEIAGTRLGKAEYFKQFQNMTVEGVLCDFDLSFNVTKQNGLIRANSTRYLDLNRDGTEFECHITLGGQASPIISREKLLLPNNVGCATLPPPSTTTTTTTTTTTAVPTTTATTAGPTTTLSTVKPTTTNSTAQISSTPNVPDKLPPCNKIKVEIHGLMPVLVWSLIHVVVTSVTVVCLICIANQQKIKPNKTELFQGSTDQSNLRIGDETQSLTNISTVIESITNLSTKGSISSEGSHRSKNTRASHASTASKLSKNPNDTKGTTGSIMSRNTRESIVSGVSKMSRNTQGAPGSVLSRNSDGSKVSRNTKVSNETAGSTNSRNTKNQNVPVPQKKVHPEKDEGWRDAVDDDGWRNVIVAGSTYKPPPGSVTSSKNSEKTKSEKNKSTTSGSSYVKDKKSTKSSSYRSTEL